MTTSPLPPLTTVEPVDRPGAGAALVAEPRTARTGLPADVQASYATRHVADAVHRDPSRWHLVSGPDVRPNAGDVVVARVTQIGNHKRIETPESRRAALFRGRLVMLAYGNRYAADQFLAHVPDSLEPASLVAIGGIAGIVTSAHDKVGAPTAVEPLGLLADSHGVVNTARFAPFRNDDPVRDDDTSASRPEVIAVLGTSVNCGKSTVMGALINGLVAAGATVGAGKITGSGSGNDPMLYQDAGAARVLDFTDFGYPTTFRTSPAEIRALAANLVRELTGPDTDVVVIEVADGVHQEEAAGLLRDDLFRSIVDRVIFSASDALGARAGVQEVLDAGLRVSAVSGVLTSSPLASAEASTILARFGVPVVGTFDFTDPIVAESVRAPAAGEPGRIA